MISRRLTLLAAVCCGLILARGAVSAQTPSLPFAFGDMGVTSFSNQGGNQPPDPLRSNLIQIVMRPDVRTAIKTTSQQREQLDELDRRSSRDLRDRAMAAAQELRRQYRRPDPSVGASAQPPLESSADRINGIQQRRQELIKSVTDAQQSIEKQIAQILRPEQMQRAVQLDFQFRGPLAFGDSEVATYLQFTAEQNAAMRNVLQGYRMAQAKARENAIRLMMGGSDNYTQLRAAAVSPTLRLQAQESYTRDEARAKKDAEQKALATLAPDQAQEWQLMQGPKFTFRTVF